VPATNWSSKVVVWDEAWDRGNVVDMFNMRTER
jgi:hypothetical protein